MGCRKISRDLALREFLPAGNATETSTRAAQLLSILQPLSPYSMLRRHRPRVSPPSIPRQESRKCCSPLRSAPPARKRSARLPGGAFIATPSACDVITHGARRHQSEAAPVGGSGEAGAERGGAALRMLRARGPESCCDLGSLFVRVVCAMRSGDIEELEAPGATQPRSRGAEKIREAPPPEGPGQKGGLTTCFGCRTGPPRFVPAKALCGPRNTNDFGGQPER